MLKIRYTRVGKKNQPHYRVVVAEHSKPVKGKFIEIVGHYNPFTKKAVLDKEKINEWLKKGAKPSNAVAKLMQKEGFKHKSIVVIKYNKKPKAKKDDGSKTPANATTADAKTQTDNTSDETAKDQNTDAVKKDTNEPAKEEEKK